MQISFLSQNPNYVSALNSGLARTSPRFHSDFKNLFAPSILSSISSVFDGQSINIFSKIIKLKRLEETSTYPKPKREYWSAILKEVNECLFLLEKNLKIEVGYKLELIYDMSPYCQNGYDF